MTATTTATSTRHDDQTGEWTVRYTWHVPDGSNHPVTTHTNHGSETAAVDAAVTLLDNQQVDATLKVIRADVKGPAGDWRAIEWTL